MELKRRQKKKKKRKNSAAINSSVGPVVFTFHALCVINEVLGSRFLYEIIWNVWKWNRIELAYVCTWYYILNKTIKTSGKESGKEK